MKQLLEYEVKVNCAHVYFENYTKLQILCYNLVYF